MKKFCLSIWMVLMVVIGIAQPPAEKSDPAAQRVLEQVRSKYERYDNLKVDFSLVIESGGEELERQRGVIYQKKEKYRLEMTEQDIISNGTTVWFYLKREGSPEVQITNPEPEDDMSLLSPNNLLRVYEQNDKFIYALVGEAEEEGRAVQKIEFKPIAKDTEYSKLRVTVDKETKQVQRIKAFGKDGLRYTLVLEELHTKEQFKDSFFTFDPNSIPNVHVEDLRW